MTNTKPLYQIIVAWLREEIEKGALEPGDRLPTEMELAQQFGVSRITARTAVKELQNLDLVYRVRGRGTFVTDEAARKIRDRGSGRGAELSIISVVLPVSRDVQGATLTGIESECKRWNYNVIYNNSYFDPRHERELLEQIVAGGSKGLIVYPCGEIHNLDFYCNLAAVGYPYLFIDRSVECVSVPVVQYDNFQGEYAVVSHVIKEGHRSIAFLGDKIAQLQSERSRLAGYCQAHIDAGIAVKDRLICGLGVSEHDMYEGRSAEEIGFHRVSKAVEGLMGFAPPPTCIVAVNDMIAFYASRTLQDMGLRIPQDVSLTGFDDLELVTHLPVPLTTVKQSFVELGQIAAQLVLKKIHDKSFVMESRMLACELVIRDSVGPPPENGRG